MCKDNAFFNVLLGGVWTQDHIENDLFKTKNRSSALWVTLETSKPLFQNKLTLKNQRKTVRNTQDLQKHHSAKNSAQNLLSLSHVAF